MPTSTLHQHTLDIWTVHNLLSPDECAALIEKGEALGFAAATVRMRGGSQMLTGVRNNDRAEWTDADYARKLWERVRSFVPGQIENCVARGLDDNFRFYRYDVGQQFKRHSDGSVTAEGGTQKSRVSFLMYLNDGYEGGETVFDESSAADDPATTAPPIVIRPQTGRGLFFIHERKHEGAQVTEGRKYLLRTDVLFDATPQ